MEFYNHLQVAAVVVAVVAVAITAPSAAQSQAKAGCESSCGNISIPYPFGTTKDCYLDGQFLVVCNKTFDPPRATLQPQHFSAGRDDRLEPTSHGVLQLKRGYNRQKLPKDALREVLDVRLSSERNWNSLPNAYKHRISSAKNKFTVVGWATLGMISGSLDKDYKTGCFSYCGNFTDVNNGSCSGVGCCQSSVPLKAQDYAITLQTIYNLTFVSAGVDPCSYAFVVEDGYYNFSSADLFDLRQGRNFSMVLDWSVGNQACQQAREKEDYACKGNTACKDADNVGGYQCFCRDGYNGNPYLHDCIDIDECQSSNDCHEKAICQNKNGGYNCSCPRGYNGDGLKTGSGCTANQKNTTLMIVGLSISTSILALLSVGLWILWGVKRRKLQQLRQKFFHQNGGTMMLQQLSGRDGSTSAAKIFTEVDLKKATKDFHQSRIIGQGGQGTVYKGILADNRVVAIKKARIGDESQVKDFVNEVALLFNVSHKNVVKLLGCCFETQVPTLIYEYVSHGSLLDQLKMAETTPFPWELRLKIATETAEALWYLHSQLSTPIIHRDIKSANILLDGNYTAKVSDFGASRLIQQDNESQKDNTAVQGTIGYLDPEYIITQQLNEKSDVYSFGVVLVELLTGTSVTEFKYKNPSKNLVIHFLSSLKAGRLTEILDPQITSEKNLPKLKEVAALARRCVRESGLERPSMKELLSELEGLRAAEKTPVVVDNCGIDIYDDKVYLLGDFSDAINGGATSSTAGYPYDSIKTQLTFDIVGAR